MAFLGFISLGSTLEAPVQTVNASDVPINADAAPRRHVYAADGTRIDAVAGQASQMHTGTITNVTAANPAVVTSAAHGLQTGARATITGVVGSASMQTLVNATHTITRVSADTFSLDGVDTSGETYTSGGEFNVSGLYSHSIVASAGNGFSSGMSYFVYSTWAISSSQRARLDSFCVY